MAWDGAGWRLRSRDGARAGVAFAGMALEFAGWRLRSRYGERARGTPLAPTGLPYCPQDGLLARGQAF